jgi:hypothetical protein
MHTTVFYYVEVIYSPGKNLTMVIISMHNRDRRVFQLNHLPEFIELKGTVQRDFRSVF